MRVIRVIRVSAPSQTSRPNPLQHARKRGGLGAKARAGRMACRAGFFKNLFGNNNENRGAQVEVAERSGEWECPFPEELVEGTFLEGRELSLAYKATRDGFGAITFHNKCDFKGPCFVLTTTEDGLRCGGFNPAGYMSTDDYKDNFNAFLFYFPSEDDEFVVLEKVGGAEAAIFDYARGGPQWGVDGFVIAPPLAPVMGGMAGPDMESDITAGDMHTAKSRLGLSYAVRPDGTKSLFGNSQEATLVEVEVYYAPEIAALY